MSDDKIIPLEMDGVGFGNVIDLAGVRIRSGRSTALITNRCEHRALTYSGSERRVWCEDCSRTIDNFDAFMVLVRGFGDMERAARQKLQAANDALKANIVRRASKQIDHVWSGGKHAVNCVHCGGGLLPEDYADGVRSLKSREIEIARRKRQALDQEKR